MKAKCCFCLKLLKFKGAIILSPPHEDEEDSEFVDVVSKYHICKCCWDKTLRPYIIDKFKEANRKKRESK